MRRLTQAARGLALSLVAMFALTSIAHASDLQARIDAAPAGATIEVGPGVYGPIKTRH
jgi:hypothetical protein